MKINNTLKILILAVTFVLFRTKRGLTKIQHLQVNEIGVEGAKNMAEVLAINNTLTTLDLMVIFVFLDKVENKV